MCERKKEKKKEKKEIKKERKTDRKRKKEEKSALVNRLYPTKVLAAPCVHGNVVLPQVVEKALAHTEQTTGNHRGSWEKKA